jgi:nucleoside-diphosphate-sugar epimerase
MPRVVVTGSSGKVGRAAVAELAGKGYTVTAVDVVPGPRDQPMRTVLADLTDAGQAIDVLRGHDAVVHMAAIPGPRMTPDPSTFATNATSTFNVFWAAEVLGIKRVVWASSETLLGLPMSASKLRQVPLDESSELFPETAYSLSKLCGEVMAAQFARRTGITFVGLRFSNVIQADEYRMFESWQDDPKKRDWNLWGYVDARDTALACRLGIEADVKGSENFIIAAADTVMRRSSAELMAASFPKCKVQPLKHPRQTLLSIDKARKVFGYEPRHSWVDEIGRK